MKRTNAPPIPRGLRIELNGEQEWTAVMQVFEDAGWVWLSGTKPHDKNTCEYASIETGKDKKIAYIAGRPITLELTAAQFLQQYQGTIEYEVGDWVVLLRSQGGDPAGTITQIIEVVDTSVDVKNVTRQPLSVEYAWSATIDSIRPATPEEIASVTKVEPVAVKKPEPYIWDGDVLPEEYWVENPWVGTPGTEFVQLFKKMDSTTSLSGDGTWYYVKNNKYYRSQEKEPDTELPIVPYELWKQILITPDNQVKQPAVEKWSIVTTDGVKVYEGDIVWWLNPSGSWYGNEKGDKVLYTDKENHKDHNKLLFSTFEAAKEYISKQKQPAGRKWKVGDTFSYKNNGNRYTILEEKNDKVYVSTPSGGSVAYKSIQADELWEKDWIPYSENKEKDDNTTNNKTKNQTTNNGNNKQQSQQDSYSSNINNQSSYGTSVNLRTDQETISTGSRSTGTSLRCSGQSELFAIKHSGYPKGSGYCEEV
jgi:hypothetical protein